MSDFRESIIITSDNVNLSNCAREQIHIPGSIQPHGILIVVDKQAFNILQASKNVTDLFTLKPTDLINTPLIEILDHTIIQKIQDCLNQDFSAINPLRININNQYLNLIVHENDNLIFLEFEPIDEKYNNDFLTFYNMTKKVINEMQSSENLQELSEVIVKNIRELTNFDRVMVYRFDEDGSGDVIAEAKQEALESFYGLRYPATDVPEPARKLYSLNYIRLIADIEYQAVPLANHPETNQPFDLSYSTLRSVSPIHIEYLKNMGVKASMSISLIHENKLWGLIACHHYQPKYLPYEIRSACEFLGKVMSLNLIAKADRENLSYKMQIKENLSELFEKISQTVDITESLYNNLDLLQSIVNAQGLAICFENEIRLFGITPELNQIHNLVIFLKNHQSKNLYYTDRLPEIYPPAVNFQSLCSGMIILYFK
jgi:light-regulated signal transduction histidine kinase (bacteriophytochrome)